MSDGRCKCGCMSQSTAGGDNYANQYSINGEVIYGTCEHGYVVVDKRGALDHSIRFDTCETPFYRIVR